MILYALVSRGKTVLAEYTATSGNFPTITRVLLGKIGNDDAKMTYVYDSFLFHYIVEDGIIYMCMTDDKDARRISFAFLEDIKSRFKSTYGRNADTAIAFSMSEFGLSVLQQRMDFFNSPQGDNFSKVNSKIEDVKNIMLENIEVVLKRGEKLDLLVNQTEEMSDVAFQFKKSSTSLKNAMIWRKIKIYLLVTFVILLILYIILAIACGPTFKKC